MQGSHTQWKSCERTASAQGQTSAPLRCTLLERWRRECVGITHCWLADCLLVSHWLWSQCRCFYVKLLWKVSLSSYFVCLFVCFVKPSWRFQTTCFLNIFECMNPAQSNVSILSHFLLVMNRVYEGLKSRNDQYCKPGCSYSIFSVSPVLFWHLKHLYRNVIFVSMLARSLFKETIFLVSVNSPFTKTWLQLLLCDRAVLSASEWLDIIHESYVWGVFDRL